MECGTEVRGVIVVLREDVMPGLARLAIRRGWQILQTSFAHEVLPVILRQKARMLVVQVSVPADEAAELIRLLRALRRRVPILAVATSNDPVVEQMTREAGASCYLPDGNTLEVVQNAVEVMLQPNSSQHN